MDNVELNPGDDSVQLEKAVLRLSRGSFDRMFSFTLPLRSVSTTRSSYL